LRLPVEAVVHLHEHLLAPDEARLDARLPTFVELVGDADEHVPRIRGGLVEVIVDDDVGWIDALKSLGDRVDDALLRGGEPLIPLAVLVVAQPGAPAAAGDDLAQVDAALRRGVERLLHCADPQREALRPRELLRTPEPDS